MEVDRASTSPARETMISPPQEDPTSASAVSWGAIFAGAAAAASLSLILVVLGTGLGFSVVSPWASHGASDTTMGASAVVWISFMALVASGTGGYLAGRLRCKWASVHTDEVYFRDTAHGFLAWAVATLATAALLTSAIGSVAGAGADVAGKAASSVGSATAAAVGTAGAVGGRSSGEDSGALGYFTDMLFRGTAVAAPSGAASGAAPSGDAAASTAEVPGIFARALKAGSLDPADAQYVAGLVAQRTGASPQDAQKRVADTFAKAQAAARDAETQAREAADKARKAAAYASLWMFFALLLGAFIASYAATIGGRRRDI